jgi:hypothetical protein
LVGGVYEFAQPTETGSVSVFLPAMRQCIERHAHLSARIIDMDTNAPGFEFCPRMDLSQHLEVLSHRSGSENSAIEALLPGILDTKLPSGIPPWKIVVLPLSPRRCFITFAFSHGLGDGGTGMIFHRTFLEALQTPRTGDKNGQLIYAPSRGDFGLQFDTKERLPISWSFLLSPLLGTYLPFLGFKASSVPDSAWTGSPMFEAGSTDRTRAKVLSVDTQTLDSTLKVCRAQGMKLTGLLHQFTLQALAELVPGQYRHFVGQTPIDLRRAGGFGVDEMGLFVGGATGVFTRSEIEGHGDQDSFEIAKSQTAELAAVAGRLKDQTIGLLRYLSDMRSWTSSKVGEKRDCSYEISNLGVFQAAFATPRVAIKDMFFAVPTDVTGDPLTLTVVSVAGGPLKIVVTWQPGALGNDVGDEVVFVEKLCQKIQGSFQTMVKRGR